MHVRYLFARFLGFALHYVFGLTCGFLENSTYMNKPCVLVPGHSSECASEWEQYKNGFVRYLWWREGNAAGGRVLSAHCEVSNE